MKPSSTLTQTLKSSDPVVEITKPQFTHEKLLKALYWVYDLFERANIPFMLLGETAKCAHNNIKLSGDGIEIGVKDTDWHESNIRIIESCYLANTIEKHKVTYTHEGVPITCLIIKDYGRNNYSYNQVMYEREFFNLPNPYEHMSSLQTV